MNLNIDWTSFSYGFILAFLLSNVISLAVAYFNRARMRGHLKSVKSDIENLKKNIMQEQQMLKQRIKEHKENN